MVGLIASAMPGGELPDAAAILDRAGQLMGGGMQVKKAQVQTLRVEMPAPGLRGTITTYSAAPNLMYMVMDLGALGKMESGSNGDVMWQYSARTGARILNGQDKLMERLRNASPAAWRDVYEQVKTTGASEVNGEECWEVETTLVGDASMTGTSCYGKKSGLALRMRMGMRQSQMEIVMGDYREIDGLQYPHRFANRISGMEMVLVVEKIEFPAEIDRERFALPAAVRELMAKGQ